LGDVVFLPRNITQDVQANRTLDTLALAELVEVGEFFAQLSLESFLI
jgi:hypothetical protein